MNNKVMIVDDSMLMRKILKKTFLTYSDFLVIEAGNGYDALSAYEVTRPSIVTMDITMDGKDGITTASEILENDPEARIIMVTALGQQEVLNRCFSIGIYDFIVKPFREERVHKTLDKVMNKIINKEADHAQVSTFQ